MIYILAVFLFDKARSRCCSGREHIVACLRNYIADHLAPLRVVGGARGEAAEDDGGARGEAAGRGWFGAVTSCLNSPDKALKRGQRSPANIQKREFPIVRWWLGILLPEPALTIVMLELGVLAVWHLLKHMRVLLRRPRQSRTTTHD